MKAEAQRIAIAEACGWSIHQITVTGLKDIAILPPGVSLKDEGAVWSYTGIDLPDYLNDLNACHEMEKVLEGKSRWNYGAALARIVRADENAFFDEIGNDFPLNDLGHFALAHLTAAQRAEAFLRTIGKWTDE